MRFLLFFASTISALTLSIRPQNVPTSTSVASTTSTTIYSPSRSPSTTSTRSSTSKSSNLPRSSSSFGTISRSSSSQLPSSSTFSSSRLSSSSSDGLTQTTSNSPTQSTSRSRISSSTTTTTNGEPFQGPVPGLVPATNSSSTYTSFVTSTMSSTATLLNGTSDLSSTILPSPAPTIVSTDIANTTTYVRTSKTPRFTDWGYVMPTSPGPTTLPSGVTELAAKTTDPPSPSELSEQSSATSAEALASSIKLADPDLGATIAVTIVPFSELPPAGTVAASNAGATGGPGTASTQSGCGPVTEYYNPSQTDWDKYDMDNWLNTWVKTHIATIRTNGFAAAFGQWATGNPDMSCNDDGSGSNCDFDACLIRIDRVPSYDLRQTYYVMESIVRLHTYFMGLREAITTSGVTVAIAQAGFASTFYTDPEVKDVIAVREVIGAVQTTFGLIACGMGFAPIKIALGSAALVTMFNGGLGTIGPLLVKHEDQAYPTLGQVGMTLAKVFVTAIQEFTNTNNLLLFGKRPKDNDPLSRDIRDYFSNGTFLAYPGLAKVSVTAQANRFLIAQAINAYWRAQKIFILGGGSCDDDDMLGNGPQTRKICQDGKAWYLYYWQEEKKSIIITDTQYGIVREPLGAGSLGSGFFAGITIDDVITSSLESYRVAGYAYTNQIAQDRVRRTLNATFTNPLTRRPNQEGVFTIPVCDISKMADLSVCYKQFILQPYGDNRPTWCGSICDNNATLTKEFIKAANMEGFEGPTFQCTRAMRQQVASRYCSSNYGVGDS